jgi:hypothetical protein
MGDPNAEDIAPGTLLIFSARWNPLARALDVMAERLGEVGVVVEHVDIEVRADLADRYGVLVLPTYVLVTKGGWSTRTGALSKSALLGWIQGEEIED